ncbi:e3 ubiquitin-protein ligase rnf5 [Fagus crenata]
MVGDTSFGKTICSICYEDLKPLSEYLQAITPCGHVFHEHCLQRWFGYCSSAKKKRSCPVCKQTCSAKNVNRLYFQSVGDSNDQNLTQPKNESLGKDIQDVKKEIDNQISPVQLESNGTGTLQTDDPYSTSHCNAIIDGMQGVDGRIYRDAQDLFQNPNWRKTFISFKSEKRLPWLKFMLPSVP